MTEVVELTVEVEEKECVRTLRGIFAAFGCPREQTERGVLAWKRNRLEGLLHVSAAALEMWENERREVAKLLCPRCAAPWAYSPPRFRLKRSGVRAHAVVGSRGHFKTCLAAQVIDLKPPSPAPHP